MAQSAERFSVVIPAFNEGDWLKTTVFSVLENTDYPDFEVVVVDDGSTDGSADFLQEGSVPNVLYHRFESSQGAIIARNKGADLATGDLLVFIDGHQKPVTANWLKVLADGLDTPETGAVMLPIVSTNNAQSIGDVYGIKDLALEPTWHRLKKPEATLVGAVAGGCFAIRQSLFESVGGFNTHLKKWGREDLELSLRLWFLGYDLWTLPMGKMAHAFDHKRAFEITWDQVDHNICVIVDCYLPEEDQQKVYDYLQSIRPKSFNKAKQKLLQNNDYQAFKVNLRKKFKRDFLAYKSQFVDYLPENLL